MIKAAVFGANGRMGKLVIREAEGRLNILQTFELGANLQLDNSIDVIIDFSLPSAWKNLDILLSRTDAALVSGTTGLSDDNVLMLKNWAEKRSVFYSSNMSVGIYALGKLMQSATSMLGNSFDKELIEFHHSHKKDSPSGTAETLLENWTGKQIYGREGNVGEREPGTIGVHAVRGGDIIGEHHLYFLGDGERLTLSHQATDRKVFALGAIRAAKFIITKAPGLYSMGDMLG